jgi:hypothetical protein
MEVAGPESEWGHSRNTMVQSRVRQQRCHGLPDERGEAQRHGIEHDARVPTQQPAISACMKAHLVAMACAPGCLHLCRPRSTAQACRPPSCCALCRLTVRRGRRRSGVSAPMSGAFTVRNWPRYADRGTSGGGASCALIPPPRCARPPRALKRSASRRRSASHTGSQAQWRMWLRAPSGWGCSHRSGRVDRTPRAGQGRCRNQGNTCA